MGTAQRWARHRRQRFGAGVVPCVHALRDGTCICRRASVLRTASGPRARALSACSGRGRRAARERGLAMAHAGES